MSRYYRERVSRFKPRADKPLERVSRYKMERGRPLERVSRCINQKAATPKQENEDRPLQMSLALFSLSFLGGISARFEVCPPPQARLLMSRRSNSKPQVYEKWTLAKKCVSRVTSKAEIQALRVINKLFNEPCLGSICRVDPLAHQHEHQ